MPSSTSPETRFDVVIAGGGFAGVYCAKALAKALGREARQRVALIADHNFMTFQPMLAEVCGSALSPRHVVNPIRRLCPGVSVLRGSIREIDYAQRRLTLHAGDFAGELGVGFDHLALALGSVVDLSRVPGMAEHAYILKNVGDAMELRGTIIDRFEEANLESNPERAKKLLTFVIVGGGFSGVETAGQINDLLAGIVRYYPRIAQPSRVVLVHSGDTLLPEISPRLGAYVEKRLRASGVELVLGTRVSSMTASRVLFNNGRSLDTHTVVSTVGNAPHPLLTALCREHEVECVRGRIVTEATLRVPGQPNLWSAGDCAAVPLPRDESSPAQNPAAEFCPPTAQFAIRQGTLLGENIARAMKAALLQPFKFKGLGELAAIGHRSAVADIFGMQFSGFFAWFLWRSVYLLKLPGVERKLRVMIDWTLDLFFPRDITLLRGRPTEVLQEMHLEPGDVVFRAGEPALSLYIVKSGEIEIADEHGILKTMRAGEHFGERALLKDRIWHFTATAKERTTLVALGASVFHTIDRASSSIHRLFEQSSSQYVTRQQVEALVATMPPHVIDLTVGQLMSARPVTVHAEMSVGDALQVVVEHPFNSFPLVDGGGRPAGVISQAQLYDALKEGAVTQTSPLSALQPIQLPTVSADAPVRSAVERFTRSGRHKLLVLDKEGRLSGILTPIDLLAKR